MVLYRTIDSLQLQSVVLLLEKKDTAKAKYSEDWLRTIPHHEVSCKFVMFVKLYSVIIMPLLQPM